MRVEIFRHTVEVIKYWSDNYCKIMLVKYIDPLPIRYQVFKPVYKARTLYRAVKQGAILLCVGARGSGTLLAIEKFRSIPSAVEFFDDHINNIKSGKLKVEVKL